MKEMPLLLYHGNNAIGLKSTLKKSNIFNISIYEIQVLTDIYKYYIYIREIKHDVKRKTSNASLSFILLPFMKFLNRSFRKNKNVNIHD